MADTPPPPDEESTAGEEDGQRNEHDGTKCVAHERALLRACVGATLGVTLTVLLCARRHSTTLNRVATPVDTLLLWISACMQAAMLWDDASFGKAAHMIFVTAIAYGAIAGGRGVLGLSAALLTLTLTLRALQGGCVFAVVEPRETGGGRVRKSDGPATDASLCVLWAVSIARLVGCGWLSQPLCRQQLTALIASAAVVLGTWR